MDWTVFLLRRWSLPNPEYYTLRYADGPQLYITEQVSTGRSTSVQAFLCGDPPKEPTLFTSLRSGSFHLWGKSSFWGAGGVPALVLLEQLALHGCYCLRAQGTGRGAQKVFARKQAGEEGLTEESQ